MTMSSREEYNYPWRMLHPNIILCAKILGFRADTTGMCFGFTMRWIEAVMTNTIDDFHERLKRITKIVELSRRGEFSKLNERDIDIDAFYNSLLLYQFSTDITSKILKRHLIQQNIEEIGEIAYSMEMTKKGGFKQTKPIYYGEFKLKSQDF